MIQISTCLNKIKKEQSLARKILAAASGPQEKCNRQKKKRGRSEDPEYLAGRKPFSCGRDPFPLPSPSEWDWWK
jgi:hypothetical protein